MIHKMHHAVERDMSASRIGERTWFARLKGMMAGKMPLQRIFCCRGYAVARVKAEPFRRCNGGISMVCTSEGRGGRPATRIRMTQTSQHSSSPSKASGTFKVHAAEVHGIYMSDKCWLSLFVISMD